MCNVLPETSLTMRSHRGERLSVLHLPLKAYAVRAEETCLDVGMRSAAELRTWMGCHQEATRRRSRGGRLAVQGY